MQMNKTKERQQDSHAHKRDLATNSHMNNSLLTRKLATQSKHPTGMPGRRR